MLFWLLYLTQIPDRKPEEVLIVVHSLRILTSWSGKAWWWEAACSHLCWPRSREVNPGTQVFLSLVFPG